MNEAFKPIAEQAPDNSRDELAEIPDFDPERAKENFECERTRLAQEEQNGRADKPRMMGFSGRILSEYDKRERERIDRLKTDMEDGKIDERTGIKSQGPVVRSQYEYEKIKDRPSIARKLGRVALDLLGITTAKSELRREREAMSVAVDEHDAERLEKKLAQEAQDIQIGIAHNVQEIMRSKEREENERKLTEKQLADAMDYARYEKRNYFRNERARNSTNLSIGIPSLLVTVRFNGHNTSSTSQATIHFDIFITYS